MKPIIKKQIKMLKKIEFSNVHQDGYNSSGHPYFFGVNINNEVIRLSGSNTPSDYRGMKNFKSVAKKKYNGTYIPRYMK